MTFFFSFPRMAAKLCSLPPLNAYEDMRQYVIDAISKHQHDWSKFRRCITALKIVFRQTLVSPTAYYCDTGTNHFGNLASRTRLWFVYRNHKIKNHLYNVQPNQLWASLDPFLFQNSRRRKTESRQRKRKQTTWDSTNNAKPTLWV